MEDQDKTQCKNEMQSKNSSKCVDTTTIVSINCLLRMWVSVIVFFYSAASFDASSFSLFDFTKKRFYCTAEEKKKQYSMDDTKRHNLNDV